MNQETCEAADYGYDDCENLATTTIKIDGERVPACAECANAIAELYWAQFAQFARS